jgi:hypothetical protein
MALSELGKTVLIKSMTNSVKSKGSRANKFNLRRSSLRRRMKLHNRKMKTIKNNSKSKRKSKLSIVQS